MKSFFSPRQNTAFVSLNDKNCKACWKCIDACTKNVIGKINLPWHKHAILAHISNCSGCRKCISACDYDAFIIIEKSELRKTKLNHTLLNNIILLITGAATIISGFVLQIGFHIGRNQEVLNSAATQKTVWSFDYNSWSEIHKLSIVIFLVFTIYHIATHWKWYNMVFSRKIFSKNVTVLVLTFLFITLALTGIIPWLTDISKPQSSLRLIFIEIHDKIALLFTLFAIVHIYRKKSQLLNSLKKNIFAIQKVNSLIKYHRLSEHALLQKQQSHRRFPILVIY